MEIIEGQQQENNAPAPLIKKSKRIKKPANLKQKSIKNYVKNISCLLAKQLDHQAQIDDSLSYQKRCNIQETTFTFKTLLVNKKSLLEYFKFLKNEEILPEWAQQFQGLEEEIKEFIRKWSLQFFKTDLLGSILLNSNVKEDKSKYLLKIGELLTHLE